LSEDVHKLIPKAEKGQEGLVTVPRKITKEIKKFANQITKKPNLIILTIQPDINSENGECFKNVEDYIKSNDGEIQYGWIIWETPNIMLEAEFHAVLKLPNGNLLDITPTNDREKEILFVPDNLIKYNGEKIDNIRYPILKNNIVFQFIKNSEKMNKEMAKLGNKFTSNDLLTIFNDIPNYNEISEQFISLIIKNRGANDICICGSGKKYKQCCK
jgi:GTPase involved in cell partitioning and DNA repair